MLYVKGSHINVSNSLVTGKFAHYKFVEYNLIVIMISIGP